jgi:BirA family biotin operon repressor/biotin-[acetyl-CoA-carboxylase] ligase
MLLTIVSIKELNLTLLLIKNLVSCKFIIFFGFMRMKIIKLDAIDSTNSFLKNKSSNQEIDDFTTVYTQNQFNGRGRTTKQWISEPNKNIALSLFKRIKKTDLLHIFLLNVIASISILELLEKYLVKDVKVKWPNDVMVKNKKISGVLIENKIKKNNSINSVMGIGINVNQQHFPDFLSATSIVNEIGSVSEIDLLANELAFIIKSNFKFLKSKSKIYLDHYNNKLHNKNQTVRFKNNIGKIEVGKIVKVDFRGNLMIMNEKGKIEYFKENEIKFL